MGRLSFAWGDDWDVEYNLGDHEDDGDNRADDDDNLGADEDDDDNIADGLQSTFGRLKNPDPSIWSSTFPTKSVLHFNTLYEYNITQMLLQITIALGTGYRTKPLAIAWQLI